MINSFQKFIISKRKKRKFSCGAIRKTALKILNFQEKNYVDHFGEIFFLIRVDIHRRATKNKKIVARIKQQSIKHARIFFAFTVGLFCATIATTKSKIGEEIRITRGQVCVENCFSKENDRKKFFKNEKIGRIWGKFCLEVFFGDFYARDRYGINTAKSENGRLK